RLVGAGFGAAGAAVSRAWGPHFSIIAWSISVPPFFWSTCCCRKVFISFEPGVLLHVQAPRDSLQPQTQRKRSATMLASGDMRTGTTWVITPPPGGDGVSPGAAPFCAASGWAASAG